MSEQYIAQPKMAWEILKERSGGKKLPSEVVKDFISYMMRLPLKGLFFVAKAWFVVACVMSFFFAPLLFALIIGCVLEGSDS